MNTSKQYFCICEREHEKAKVYRQLKSNKRPSETGLTGKCRKCKKLSDRDEGSLECQLNINRKLKCDDCIIHIKKTFRKTKSILFSYWYS